MEFVPAIVEAQGAFGSGARDTLNKFVFHAHCNRGVDRTAFKTYWVRRLSATLLRGMADAAHSRARAIALARQPTGQQALPLGGNPLMGEDFGHFPAALGPAARGDG